MSTGSDSQLPAIDDDAIEAFRKGLRGTLLRPDDEGYDAARTIWNAMIDKRPAFIVRCAGVSDVISAVSFARNHELVVSVRGGGHNVAGSALCNGGLMIDLSGMKSIRVDPERRTARAEPGLTWAEFDHETQSFGLATTGGVVGSTGVAGLTLGGGVGWLHAVHGLTADNLISADVVLADGSFLTASLEENADLFWALKGGGGNFGIVTSFEYQLHALRTVLAGPVFHPAERAPEVLRFYREFIQTVPDELTVYAGFLTNPEGQRLIALVACYVGEVEEGERLLKPLREFGEPVADLIGEIPYTALQSMFDDGFPPGLHNYWKSGFLADLGDEVLDTVVRYAVAPPSATSLVMIEHYHGAYSKVGAHESAYPHRDAHLDLLILASWADPADTDANEAWARSFHTAIKPHLTDKVFPNLMGQDEVADRVALAYGSNYERLREIKKRYDPTNFFRMNANIKPTE